MNNTIKQFIHNSIEELNIAKDDIIKDAITFNIGNNDWVIDDISDRCTLIRHVNSQVETFIMDGIKLIEFYDITYNNDNNLYKLVMNFRKLYQ